MTSPERLSFLAHVLADAMVVSDIECNAHAELDALGRRWFDTRPMLDPREQPEEIIDMTRQALEYALARPLVVQHSHKPWLVRILVLEAVE
jgi:hypothetical protein